MNKLHYYILPILILALLQSCKSDVIQPEGDIITRELNIDDYSKIEVLENIPVTIVDGPVQKVEVTGHNNIINLLKTDVSNGLWRVKMESGDYEELNLNISITTPYISRIISSSQGNISISNYINTVGLTLNANGSGQINMSNCTNIGTLTSVIMANGDINMLDNNTCTDAFININGTGNFNGFNLVSENCIADIQGNSNINITVNNSLDGTINGNGKIYYKGTPSTITPNITGNGEIIDAN